LSINQTKLSGQCGRLKCCLNYELDTYLDALQYFPEDADVIEVARGRAFLVKKDIFRNLMWYTMADSTKHYPLSIETVKKIKEQNKQGIKPEALETVEIVSEKPKEVEPEFVDVVGQITLKSLDKNNRKRRGNDRNDRRFHAADKGTAERKEPSRKPKQGRTSQNQKNSSRLNTNRNRPPSKS
jgi:hypothetical protein